jgi:transcriptional regulator with XRE-family HTH domain
MPRTHQTSQKDILLGMLRDARAEHGVTQEMLADRLGFRQTDISKAERGVRRLDVLELRAWVVALGMPFPEFVVELDARLASLEALQRHARLGSAKPSNPKRRA